MSNQKFLWLVLGTVFAAAAMGAVDGKKPDFSGDWKFVPEKSKLQISHPDSVRFRIDHRDPLFKFSRTFIVNGVTDSWGIDLTTDGKEVTQKEEGRIVHGRLYWDGDDLIFDSVITLKDRKAANIVRYHLSDGGKTFTATERFRGPVQKYDNIWVFTKE